MYIPHDLIDITVSLDVRALTPNGSEHLFSYFVTPLEATLDAVADHLAMIGADAAASLLERLDGIDPHA